MITNINDFINENKSIDIPKQLELKYQRWMNSLKSGSHEEEKSDLIMNAFMRMLDGYHIEYQGKLLKALVDKYDMPVYLQKHYSNIFKW